MKSYGSLLLALSLAMPAPAWALRGQEVLENSGRFELQAGLEAGPPQPFSSLADQGSRAPSGARESEAVGPSDSTAGGRPGGRQEAAGGRQLPAGLEEVDPSVREILAGLFRLPDDFSRVVWLGERMAGMDPSQLEQMVTHLFWVADRKEVGQALMRVFGSNVSPAPMVISHLLYGLALNAGKGGAEGYHALRAVLSNLDSDSRKQFSDMLFQWLNQTDPNRQGSLKDLPLHLDEANIEAQLRPAWAGLPARFPKRTSLVQGHELAARYESIGATYFLKSDHQLFKRSNPLGAGWQAQFSTLAFVAAAELNPQRAAELVAEWRQKIPDRLNVPGLPATLVEILPARTHPQDRYSMVGIVYERLASHLEITAQRAAGGAPGGEILRYRALEYRAQAEKLYADFLVLWSAKQADARAEEEAAKHYVLAAGFRAQMDQIRGQKLQALGLAGGSTRLTGGLEERQPVRTPELGRFASVDALAAAYPSILKGSPGAASILEEFRRRGAGAWVVPDRQPTAAMREVRALARPLDPGREESLWELALEDRLNRVSDRIKEVFFSAAAYPADGKLPDLPAVAILEAGASLPAEPDRPIAVIEIRSLGEVEELFPRWVYSVAMSRALRGKVIGPVIGVLTFEDERGRILHAIFA